MSSKIPNSNPWIKPNQIDYFSLDDFNPAWKKSIEEGYDINEIENDFSITLTLRRALDAFKSGTPHKLRNYSAYKNSQELLDLSYKDLNSYVSNLDKQELEEVYGASPLDIQVVKDYLKNNKDKHLPTLATYLPSTEEACASVQKTRRNTYEAKRPSRCNF